jgi:hypothetical protein
MSSGHITDGVSVLARVFMFATWAKIAVDHHNHGCGLADPNEAYHDYLVSVAASAFALDGFVKDLPLARPPARSVCSLGYDRSAADHLWDWINHNYLLEPAHAAWHEELHWLFDLRDNAVHYMGSLQPLYKHPNGTHYHPLVGIYDETAAARGIRLARDVILHCLDNPNLAIGVLCSFIGQHIEGSKGVDAFDNFT